MPPTPDHHPFRERPRPQAPRIPDDAEDGSLVAEYGLLAVLGATIAGLAIKWASGGAVFELLDAVLARARALVGM